MPEDFTWADTIGADAVMGKSKGTKGRMEKDRYQRGNGMSYDASLVCYFNPTEYSAAMNRGLYTGPPAEATAKGFDGKSKVPVVEQVNPVEEAIIARRRIATYVHFGKTIAVCACVYVGVSLVVTDCWTISNPTLLAPSWSPS